MVTSQRGEFATGWGILLTASIGTAVTGVHFHVIGAMLNALHAAYGWSRGEAAGALTIAAVAAAIVHPPVGILVDRFGPRRVLIPGVLCFGIGVTLLGFAGPSLIAWYVAYCLFSIAVAPAGSMVLSTAVVRHFERHRGLALACALAVSGVSTAMIPTLVLHLLTAFDVRGTFVILATGAVIVMLPGALFLIPRNTVRRVAERRAPTSAEDRRARKAMLCSGRFWRLAVAVIMLAFWIGVFSVHFQPMLTDSGLSAAQAARIALYMAPGFLLGCFSSGLLFDRLPPQPVGAAIFAAPALPCMLLLYAHGNFSLAAGAAFLVGFAMAAPVNAIGCLAARYFAVSHFGFAIGTLYMILGLALGVGSWAAGYCFDAVASYGPVLFGLAAASLIAALLLATLGPPPIRTAHPA
jgi:predicted MFS family arabinose efflux permease